MSDDIEKFEEYECVFIISYFTHDGDQIEAVFSTKQKAINYIKTQTFYPQDDLVIYQYVIDKAEYPNYKFFHNKMSNWEEQGDE